MRSVRHPPRPTPWLSTPLSTIHGRIGASTMVQWMPLHVLPPGRPPERKCPSSISRWNPRSGSVVSWGGGRLREGGSLSSPDLPESVTRLPGTVWWFEYALSCKNCKGLCHGIASGDHGGAFPWGGCMERGGLPGPPGGPGTGRAEPPRGWQREPLCRRENLPKIVRSRAIVVPATGPAPSAKGSQAPSASLRQLPGRWNADPRARLDML